MFTLSALLFIVSLLPSCLIVSSLLQKPGMDLADTYITFVRQNQDILRDRISDELYIEKVFDVSFFRFILYVGDISVIVSESLRCGHNLN